MPALLDAFVSGRLQLCIQPLSSSLDCRPSRPVRHETTSRL